LTPSRLASKLALGTVQLGLPYGINNSSGKPSDTAAFEILEAAVLHGIDLLDSAEAYGNSLEVIFNYLRRNPSAKFKVISKFIGKDERLTRTLEQSMHALKYNKLYAYMYHRFEDYVSGNYRADLARLRQEGTILKTGVSLYQTSELATVINDKEIDIIQIPLNPFDLSEEKKALLREAKSVGKEIHVRSVYLQGLFFMRPEELTGNLRTLADPLIRFQDLIQRYGIDVRQACLNYALRQEFVDYALIGVETKMQLEENVAALLPAFDDTLTQELERIPIPDGSLLNPANWKR
jgi:aryl-alcohol dehydrogenase-like predicted oxidoreductase